MRSPSYPRGERELDVLEALWILDRPATVGEVRDALEARGKALAYTTVQTMLNRLVAKGSLERDERERAHRYAPRLGRGAPVRAARGWMFRGLLGGSPESLAVHLVDAELRPEALERLSRAIEAKRRGKAGSGKAGSGKA